MTNKLKLLHPRNPFQTKRCNMREDFQDLVIAAYCHSPAAPKPDYRTLFSPDQIKSILDGVRHDQGILPAGECRSLSIPSGSSYGDGVRAWEADTEGERPVKDREAQQSPR
jgi:hypothetical protein